MSDRVKGGLFNALGDIVGLTVFDPFAGSGALSIEAVSRGAESALAIDSDRKAAETIKQNCTELRLQKKIKVVQANVSSWSDDHADHKFDLVILDPPYDHLQVPLLTKLLAHVKQDTGILVLSWPGKQTLPEFRHFGLIKSHSYGDAQLGFYRYAG